MSYDFTRIKKQLKARDETVDDTIKRSKQIKPGKSFFSIRYLSVISAVFVLLICCLTIPAILQKNNTPQNSNSSKETSHSIEQQQNAMAFNEGVTISPALSELLSKTNQDTVFSVGIKILNLTEAYENEYNSVLYDGRTYDSWWHEYESINARMIEIEGMLKDGPNVALENEYNECVEKSEEINLFLSEIVKKQKSESIQKEIAYFKTLGIETVYKGGILTAEINAEQIKSIKGKCDYMIDIIAEKDPVEEIHYQQ